MKKHLIVLVAVVTLSLPVATLANYEETTNQAEFGNCHADPIYEQAFIGKTTLGARVRSIACMDGSKVLTTLAANAKVQVVGKTDGWYKVKLSDGTKGWIGSWLIVKTADTSVAAPKVTKVETVTKTGSLSEAYTKAQTLSLADLRALKEKVANLISQLEKAETKAKEISKEPARSNGTITLSGTPSGSAAKLNWKLNGMTSAQGFKVVVSDTANPVYPGDEYHYLSDPNTISDSWTYLSPGTHHFRVCEYLGGKCGVYSNDVALEIHD